MNYKWHTRISLAAVVAVAACILYTGQHSSIEVAAFCLMGYFNTVYASPDIDHPKSAPTKHMGLAGKVTSRSFKHRGLLHNPYFWTTLYVIIGLWIHQKYNYEAWWITGGLIALYTHIILDNVSTKAKRTRTKIKRNFHL